MKQYELSAMQKYRDMLPPEIGSRIFELWSEYEEKQTPEARLVSALDKVDANLQANFHQNGDVRYWLDCEDGEQYRRINTEKKPAVAVLDEQFIEELENGTIALSQENMRRWPDKFK